MKPQWGGSVTGCSNLSRTGQSVRLGVEWQLPHFMPHCNFFRPPFGSFRTKQLGGCWVGAHLLVKTDISGTPKKTCARHSTAVDIFGSRTLHSGTSKQDPYVSPSSWGKSARPIAGDASEETPDKLQSIQLSGSIPRNLRKPGPIDPL